MPVQVRPLVPLRQALPHKRGISIHLTIDRLSELFLYGGNIEAADSKDFVAEIIDKYKSCDNLVYELNSISIALAVGYSSIFNGM